MYLILDQTMTTLILFLVITWLFVIGSDVLGIFTVSTCFFTIIFQALQLHQAPRLARMDLVGSDHVPREVFDHLHRQDLAVGPMDLNAGRSEWLQMAATQKHQVCPLSVETQLKKTCLFLGIFYIHLYTDDVLKMGWKKEAHELPQEALIFGWISCLNSNSPLIRLTNHQPPAPPQLPWPPGCTGSPHRPGHRGPRA